MDVSDLNLMTGSRTYTERKAGFIATLVRFGAALLPLHILAQVLAQVIHESGRFKYVREIWGPTAAQKRYEWRADLGNTQAGDGKRFMGRDLIQNTGRFNYRNLTAWVRRLFPAAPDFEKTPEALERPEWLGISVVWFFTTRPKLMAACEAGDCVRVSEIVNGGHNGLTDRLALYVRCALVLLGYSATDVRGFQEAAGIEVDGMAGQVTRAELHRALKAKASGVKVIAEIPPRTPEASTVETPDPEPQPSLWLIILTILGITKG